MDKPVILDEWEIKLVVRVVSEESVFPPDKWDYTVLLDLNTGKGEQAWVENAGIKRSGTEDDLESIYWEDDEGNVRKLLES